MNVPGFYSPPPTFPPRIETEIALLAPPPFALRFACLLRMAPLAPQRNKKMPVKSLDSKTCFILLQCEKVFFQKGCQELLDFAGSVEIGPFQMIKVPKKLGEPVSNGHFDDEMVSILAL